MTLQTQRLHEFSKLLRLQQIRISAATTEYKNHQIECKKFADAMQKRQLRIDKLNSQRNNLLSNGDEASANHFIRFTNAYNARIKWIDNDLERDEFWIKDDLRELREAETKLAESKNKWLRLQATEEKLKKVYVEFRRKNMRIMEASLEAEEMDVVYQETVKFP